MTAQGPPFKVKSPKPVPQKVSDEEVAKLKAAIMDRKTHKKSIERDILIIDLYYNAGMRLADLANFHVKDLRLEGKLPYLIVLQGKGGKDRDVSLNPYICGRLKSFTTGMIPGDKVIGIAPKTVNSLFTNWAKRAGVPQLHPHSLRHKFATDIINSGGSLRDVQYLMGHESLATTEVYLAVTDEGLSKTVGLLDNSTAKEPAPGSKEVTDGLEKMKDSLNDIKKTLGVGAEDPSKNAAYLTVNMDRDAEGNLTTFSAHGEIPAEKVAQGIADFVTRHVKFEGPAKEAKRDGGQEIGS